MLLHIDGFDQYQKQTGATLLASLQAAGYVTSQGLAMGAGRHENSYALELQVSAGAAGATWSRRTNTFRVTMYDAAFDSNGRWVIVGKGGAMGTSQDTITWSPLTSGTPNDLRSITYGDGLWVAVGANGTIITAPDGVTWTARVCPLPNATFTSIHFANGRYVAVGFNGNAGAIITSTDGISWANITENAGTRGHNRVRYGDKWMAVGVGGQCMFSDDGIAWTSVQMKSTANVTGCAFDGTSWMVAQGQGVSRTADHGVTWTQQFAEVVRNRSLTDIGYTDGRWVVSTDYGGIATSDDIGLTWTTRSLPGSGSQVINSLKVRTGATAVWLVTGTAFSEGNPSASGYIYVSAAPPTTVKRTFTSNATKMILGFAHRANSRGRILSIDGLFDMDWPAGIEILGQSGEAVPIRNAWYYYELEIDRIARTLTLYINNTRDMVVEMPDALGEMTDFTVTWQSENGAISRIDDMYFLDSFDGVTGVKVEEGQSPPEKSRLTSRLRPIRIPVRLPTADADVSWDASGQGPHWTHVGLLPPSTASYIRSSNSGAKDMFTSTTALPEGAGTTTMPIIAVGVIALAQKSDLDHRQLGLVVSDGKSEKEVVDTTLSMTPEYSLGVFETAPDGNMWTAESIESTQFGVAVRP